MFDALQSRVRKLESAQRLTAANSPIDVKNPRPGDIVEHKGLVSVYNENAKKRPIAGAKVATWQPFALNPNNTEAFAQVTNNDSLVNRELRVVIYLKDLQHTNVQVKYPVTFNNTREIFYITPIFMWDENTTLTEILGDEQTSTGNGNFKYGINKTLEFDIHYTYYVAPGQDINEINAGSVRIGIPKIGRSSNPDIETENMGDIFWVNPPRYNSFWTANNWDNALLGVNQSDFVIRYKLFYERKDILDLNGNPIGQGTWTAIQEYKPLFPAIGTAVIAGDVPPEDWFAVYKVTFNNGKVQIKIPASAFGRRPWDEVDQYFTSIQFTVRKNWNEAEVIQGITLSYRRVSITNDYLTLELEALRIRFFPATNTNTIYAFNGTVDLDVYIKLLPQREPDGSQYEPRYDTPYNNNA